MEIGRSPVGRRARGQDAASARMIARSGANPPTPPPGSTQHAARVLSLAPPPHGGRLRMATYCSTCDSKDAEIARLRGTASLDMYNQAGGLAAIAALPTGTYAVVFCDIDRLKAINAATGNQLQTNRYLRAGLRVRHGEIAMQLFGDEFVFVLQCDDVSAFVRRLQRQLAAQPL